MATKRAAEAALEPLNRRASVLLHLAVNREHDNGADDCPYESSAFVSSIPANCLTQKRRYEGANDLWDACHNEALRFVRSGHEELRDHARDEADDNGPDEANVRAPSRNEKPPGPQF